ncbi:DUF3379 domain-containing protein [Aestuariibacter sp. AA17]|uniref:DUF3379 domain-containing protein n=1 Tax=Fluctibacter corallii TaxID=2984329 RepID=A0ABT3A9Q1_9ALTE|nr:DUF3379 domain-containing protein [Aestuariibacter sp. AA17]MCV2885408.1 DUF3379 domain-containing protein [Aestuariibacter sp. AA17]
MDDLQFRRTIYADPNTTSDEVKQAANQDPNKQRSWDEVRNLDKAIHDASQIEIPEGLAERLILKQSFEQHQQTKTKRNAVFGIAASIVFVFGFSFILWQQQPANIADHALAHVYHEADGYALKVSDDIPMDVINARISSIGAKFASNLGRVYFASHCFFDSVKSFHMVVDGEEGKVTVFVIPKTEGDTSKRFFSDDNLHGEIIEYPTAHLVMVADKGQSFDEVKKRVEENIRFSA